MRDSGRAEPLREPMMAPLAPSGSLFQLASVNEGNRIDIENDAKEDIPSGMQENECHYT